MSIGTERSGAAAVRPPWPGISAEALERRQAQDYLIETAWLLDTAEGEIALSLERARNRAMRRLPGAAVRPKRS
jgi:hypothetical protein